MKPRREDILSDTIVRLYTEDKLSGAAIAKILGCGPALVYFRLRQATYTARSRGLPGAHNPHWKGGRYVGASGYVYVSDPNGHRKYIAEHRLVWEKLHQQELPSSWHIHHINGIKTDNRPSNLVAIPPRKHGPKYGSFVRALQVRIRELELEIDLLKKALDNNQLIFRIGDN